MRESEISRTLRQHLAALSGLPTIYHENQDVPETQARPYTVIQMVRASRNNIANDGTDATNATGYMQVTIVTEVNTFSTDAEGFADDICAHFPKALSLQGTGGLVTITNEPDVLPGLRDGSDWRTSVRVPYHAI